MIKKIQKIQKLPNEKIKHLLTPRVVVKKTDPYIIASNLKKITTYIKPETAIQIKIKAAKKDCWDYEIIQEALDAYFTSRK